MKRLLWFSGFILLMSGAMAQTDPASKAPPKKPAAQTRVSAKEVQELRDALAAQQQQMEEQRQQMDQLKSQLQQLLDATQQANASAQKVQGSAEQAQATAAQAQQSASEAQRAADQASTNATDVKTALSVVDSKTKDDDKRLSALQDILGRFRFVRRRSAARRRLFSGLPHLHYPQSRPPATALRGRRQIERGLYRRLRSCLRFAG